MVLDLGGVIPHLDGCRSLLGRVWAVGGVIHRVHSVAGPPRPALTPLKLVISDPQPLTQSDGVPVIQHKTLDIVNITVEKDANENIGNSKEQKEEENNGDSPNFRLAQEVESKSKPVDSESTSVLESEEHEGRNFFKEHK